MTLELAKLKKIREEQESRFADDLNDLIQKVAAQVDQERESRTENHQRLAERLNSET